MAALLGGGFVVPEKLRKPTALASANYYDQIAIRAQDGIVEINNADCFHWQDHVFRANEADYAAYKPHMPTKTKKGKSVKTDMAAYKKWRTWQMSDHLPLWTEIKTDFTEDYLRSLKSGKTPLAEFSAESGPSADANAVTAEAPPPPAPAPPPLDRPGQLRRHVASDAFDAFMSLLMRVATTPRNRMWSGWKSVVMPPAEATARSRCQEEA